MEVFLFSRLSQSFDFNSEPHKILIKKKQKEKERKEETDLGVLLSL